MEQLESTSSELHATLERLRRAEAERLGATREVEGLRKQVICAGTPLTCTATASICMLDGRQLACQ